MKSSHHPIMAPSSSIVLLEQKHGGRTGLKVLDEAIYLFPRMKAAQRTANIMRGQEELYLAMDCSPS
jgi:hypothetical protein